MHTSCIDYDGISKHNAALPPPVLLKVAEEGVKCRLGGCLATTSMSRTANDARVRARLESYVSVPSKTTTQFREKASVVCATDTRLTDVDAESGESMVEQRSANVMQARLNCRST
eukprot:4412869-Pleurochrysis_carterae.AAC.2